MKKKIVIIIPSLMGGGAERVIVNIVNYIDLSKFDLRLIVLKGNGPFLKDIPSYVKIIDLNSDRVRYSLIKIIKSLNSFKPDVIFSTLRHLNLALLSIRVFLKGKPKIIIREANTPSKDIITKNKVKKKLIIKLYKYLYSKADLIVAQCKNMKLDIIKTFDINHNKVKYIYNPIDLEKITTNMTKFNPYTNDKINIVAIGRLSFQKDYKTLITAFKIVQRKLKNIHLTILGEGELENELRTYVNSQNLNNNITFLGFKENPYPYLHYADLYVLSSKWEGFPNTLLEALACGTKVISTDCESGPREILEDNKYGMLVPTEDPRSLASTIITYLNQKSKTNKRAMEFDVRSIIQEYEEIFNSK